MFKTVKLALYANVQYEDTLHGASSVLDLAETVYQCSAQVKDTSLDAKTEKSILVNVGKSALKLGIPWHKEGTYS